MLPKSHLTSHSRISDSRWVITPSWLSRTLRFFVCRSSVYSCHLFLIYSASFMSLLLLSLIVPIFAWNGSLDFSIFLKRFLVFVILLFSSISLHCSLKKAFLFLLVILWNSTFSWIYLFLSPLPFTSFLFSTNCKASSDNHYAFLHFLFFEGEGLFLSLPPIQCYESLSIDLQVFYQI